MHSRSQCSAADARLTIGGVMRSRKVVQTPILKEKGESEMSEGLSLNRNLEEFQQSIGRLQGDFLSYLFIFK